VNVTQFRNENEAVIKCYDLAVTRYSSSVNLILSIYSTFLRWATPP